MRENNGDIKIVADQRTDGCKPEIALKHVENALTANKNVILIRLKKRQIFSER